MSKVIKSAIGLIIVTGLAKVIGFIREIVLASAYGASELTDAYLISTSIPNAIFAIIGIALSTTFIPIYCDIKKKNGRKEADKFTSNIINICILISIILVLIITINIEVIVKLFAVGFSGEILDLTIKMTKISIWSIVLLSINAGIKSFLNANDNFVVSGLIGIPHNIAIMGSIFLSVILKDETILIYGFIIGSLIQILVQVPSAIKLKYEYKFILNFKDEYIRKLLILLGPVLIGVSVDQVNTIVDKTLASTLPAGSISALNYSNRLITFVMAIFIISISSVIYPMLSNLSLEKTKEKFIESVNKIINIISILIIPISVGSIALSTPIVRVLFQRGAFDENATTMTAIALVFYSIGIIGFGLREVLSKVFYSLQDTKIPMINGIIAMILNIIINLVLIGRMGHAGLALGTSLSSILCTQLLFKSLKKKIGDFGQKKIYINMIKSIFSSLLMGISTYFIFKILSLCSINEMISLLISIVFGGTIYLMLMIILKCNEINEIIMYCKLKLKVWGK